MVDVAAVPLPRSQPVEARNMDGVVWRRHWWESTRLVIDFVDLAVAVVDDVSWTVTG